MGVVLWRLIVEEIRVSPLFELQDLRELAGDARAALLRGRSTWSRAMAARKPAADLEHIEVFGLFERDLHAARTSSRGGRAYEAPADDDFLRPARRHEVAIVLVQPVASVDRMNEGGVRCWDCSPGIAGTPRG